MLIRISNAVLTDPRWFPLFNTILNILELPFSRHTFDTAQIREILNSNWVQSSAQAQPGLAQLIKGSVKASSRDLPSDGVTLVIDLEAPVGGQTVSQSEIRVHPNGLLTLLCQPFSLIVEDETSDGSFVLWIARLLGKDAIRNSYNQGRLIFRHAGSKGQFVRSAQALSFGVWPKENKPILALTLRAGAMMDSDDRYPGEGKNNAVKADIEQHVAFLKILERRMIENYLPHGYFSRRLSQDGMAQHVEAFYRMTEQQRAHFHYKRGFTGDGGPLTQLEFANDQSRPQQERSLFQGISVVDWGRLAPGFGDRFGSIYYNPSYRCSPGETTDIGAAVLVELEQFLNRVIKYL